MRDLIRELWDIRRGRASDVGGPGEMWQSEEEETAPGEDPAAEADTGGDSDSDQEE